MAKAAIKKMKKAEEDYKSIHVRYKETRCKVERLNEELNNAYSKIKFFELEVVQANAKVERVASKKLDEVLAYQKPSLDRSGLGYTGESSSSSKVSKEMKFAKNKEPSTPFVDKVKFEKNPNVVNQKVLTKSPNPIVVKPKAKGKSLPKAQKGPQTQHYCHHCGIQWHTRPNCHKFQALKNANLRKPRRQGKGNGKPKQPKGQEEEPIMSDVMKMIGTITSCLANFTLRFDNHGLSTQFLKDITPNAHAVWVKKGTHA